MYEIREISLADTRRLFGYLQQNAFGAAFNLKGFDYPWILGGRVWAEGERVLDVGASYSEVPIHIARAYGCEVWAVDDFGVGQGDAFWRRNRDPAKHIQNHPEVKYVLERLGNPNHSSLPLNYFDCIVSASALEHIQPHAISMVWKHMDQLLRPGGEMLHALDVALPTSRGLLHVLLALVFDLGFGVIPQRLRLRFAYETPNAYIRTALGALKVSGTRKASRLSVLDFVLNPEILLEPPENTFNRIIKDGMDNVHHFRVGSLLIHLRKIGEEGG